MNATEGHHVRSLEESSDPTGLCGTLILWVSRKGGGVSCHVVDE